MLRASAQSHGTASSAVIRLRPVRRRGGIDLLRITGENLDLYGCGNARRLPIVDCDGKLVGIITADDIVRLLAEELRCVTDIIREESP